MNAVRADKENLIMTTDQPIAYTVDRALEVLGIGRTKFYEEIKAGRLKAKKVGQRTLVTSAALNEWLEALPSCASK